MSVLKRLTNLARGYAKTLGRDDRPVAPEVERLSRRPAERDLPRPPRPVGEDEPDSPDDARTEPTEPREPPKPKPRRL